jgi:hypothetical protein
MSVKGSVTVLLFFLLTAVRERVSEIYHPIDSPTELKEGGDKYMIKRA